MTTQLVNGCGWETGKLYQYFQPGIVFATLALQDKAHGDPIDDGANHDRGRYGMKMAWQDAISVPLKIFSAILGVIT